MVDAVRFLLGYALSPILVLIVCGVGAALVKGRARWLVAAAAGVAALGLLLRSWLFWGHDVHGEMNFFLWSTLSDGVFPVVAALLVAAGVVASRKHRTPRPSAPGPQGMASAPPYGQPSAHPLGQPSARPLGQPSAPLAGPGMMAPQPPVGDAGQQTVLVPRPAPVDEAGQQTVITPRVQAPPVQQRVPQEGDSSWQALTPPPATPSPNAKPVLP